ncbi:MAG: hypothetical protein AAGG01_16725 [Planctomycetota bacterium]
MQLILLTLAALGLQAPSASVQPSGSPPAVAAATETGALPLDPSVWITPGARIPDVELPRVDGGGLVRLSQFRGKKVLLLQFASW